MILTVNFQERIRKNLFPQLKMEDPDEGDILTASIPSNSPNLIDSSLEIRKLYFDSKSSKALVPYNVTIRATDWEGLVLEKVFEILVDDEGQIIIEEVNSGAGGDTFYDQIYRY